jgi:hypothetical protein
MKYIREMNSGYNFKVTHAGASNNTVQMRSGGFQKPFFFGGSSVPYDLGIPSNVTTTVEPVQKYYSATERVLKSRK